MRIVSAADIDRVLTYPALIDALGEAFRAGITVPVRHHHTIAQPGAPSRRLLTIPARSSSALSSATEPNSA